jgi:hypothetical protein
VDAQRRARRLVGHHNLTCKHALTIIVNYSKLACPDISKPKLSVVWCGRLWRRRRGSAAQVDTRRGGANGVVTRHRYVYTMWVPARRHVLHAAA